MFGKKSIVALALIIISFVLFVMNLIGLNNGEDTLYGILSNLLLILAMALVIVGERKKTE
ncbi:hypothetical protein Murru_1337 [Allomuricauda ruestringensis DSM 13258]|uniref:Uncharacterized protein n=1 Tax=Allomuricauda ruestringensis (strain DSM 13258 / CIP 107369 / LMG 19739 / B1) TaxID=886377 RepID=G2PPC7_ALLRU|nr:hypothetical protein [Allomuricauda ruestringensis]AEM70379.1 hypothetical protein Murru_1337 [Allomuricauda ruestringensis DSM 13258]